MRPRVRVRAGRGQDVPPQLVLGPCGSPVRAPARDL